MSDRPLVWLMGRDGGPATAAIASAGATAVHAEQPALAPDPLPRCAVVADDHSASILAAWRNDPRTSDVPVIALVAHPAEGLFHDAFVAGADDAVPLHDAGGLKRRIASLLERPGAQAQAAKGRVTIVDPDVARRRRFGRALRRAGLELSFAAELSELSGGSADVVVVHESLGRDDAHHRVRDATGAHAMPVVVIVGRAEGDHAGRRVERTATVPESVPADHLLFVVNELFARAASDQRASPRLLFATLCAFRRARDLTPSYGLSYNISRGGAFVRTLDPPERDQEVWIELRPPQGVGAVHLRGIVRWVSRGGTTPHGFAVEWSAHKCPPFDLDRYRDQYRRLLDEPQQYGLGQARAAAAPVSVPGKSTRILVADDDEMMRKAIARIFRDEDMVVTLAEDGERAVELFRNERHDVVVTDIHMPRLTGIELLKAIRADDEDVPVIITTGQPEVQTAIQALAHGALRYMEKPVDVKALRDAVHDAVTMGRLARYRRQAALLASETPAREDVGELDAALTRAITSLSAHYQPIVRWPAREIVAYEVLARPSEPRIPHPGALFDAAERLDRLHDVGRRMRALAPQAVASGEAQLFVNLHPEDLQDDDLYARSSALAAMAGRVVLELTERANLVGVKDLRGRVARLREIGFRIAVDDLGAGYAGLSAFCALDPDVVKLDMSLIRNVHRSNTAQRVVRSMVQACRDLDIVVVAEGVETPEELATLCELGCDVFQGYLFARPAPGLAPIHWPE